MKCGIACVGAVQLALFAGGVADSSCSGAMPSNPECNIQFNCYGESKCCLATGSCQSSDLTCELYVNTSNGGGGAPPFPPASPPGVGSGNNNNNDGCRCAYSTNCTQVVQCWGSLTCDPSLCTGLGNCCNDFTPNRCHIVGGTSASAEVGDFCLSDGNINNAKFKFCANPTDTTTTTTTTTSTKGYHNYHPEGYHNYHGDDYKGGDKYQSNRRKRANLRKKDYNYKLVQEGEETMFLQEPFAEDDGHDEEDDYDGDDEEEEL